MSDYRLVKLAEKLIGYSLDLQSGENVFIDVRGEGEELAKELIRQSYDKGANPFVRYIHPSTQREILLGMTEESAKYQLQWETAMWKDVHKRIIIMGEPNESEYADVPADRFHLYNRVMKPVRDYTASQIKWVGINYPTNSLAERANMSIKAFEDFYYEVCTLDYRQMKKAMSPLKELMERTDKVRIIGPDTDLTFSINGIPKHVCAGEINVPDGEVYTSPVRHSVNGTIAFNIPGNYLGSSFSNIRFVFRDGKIIEATSNNSARLNQILDADEGARYLGEFAIGVNPLILNPMNNILFDEKIAGSFHITPGFAIWNSDNGNRSTIHWDITNIQRQEWGGGEIWFDDVLIRKDGAFVLDSLIELNSENLIKHVRK